ncbi:MAG: tyrosine-protein phosphatase [Blastocatellia bacterium]|jgi:protein tyrosine/serine phosphatase|nr:tyrosine-protein phosphatase [Blastocatellia bacterium]
MRRTITLRTLLVSLVTLLALVAATAKDKPSAFSNIRIKNFGQMSERFYRGAQPKEEDYQSLKDLGVNTIIDLRDTPTDYEKRSTEALGMRYINIPMVDKGYPESAQIEQFLKLANDPATGKFFVHCAGGRHRTGIMGAVYRFTVDRWNYDQVYSEMKNYDFYSSWGHGDQKKYVQDYWANLQAKQASATVVATSAEGHN